MSTIDISKLKYGFPWYDSEDDKQSPADYLIHYGTPRHSGRYPWGSGDNPYQHGEYFLQTYNNLKNSGMAETDIAKHLNMSVNELRARKSNSLEQVKAGMTRQIIKLKEAGHSNVAIGKMLGVPDTTVGNYLRAYNTKKANSNQALADTIMGEISNKGMVDIGKGVAETLGISDSKLRSAVALLKDKGYVEETVFVQQVTNPDQYTTLKVLAPPGTSRKDVLNNRFDVSTIGDIHKEINDDGTESYYSFERPKSIDGKRVFIRYADDNADPNDNGKERDGLIQLRRGVEDISLGNDLYSQVRIAVDGKSYMKGMAVYSDNIPDGYDVVYNTNKPVGTPPEKVFKPLKKIKTKNENGDIVDSDEIDWDNPFGSSILPGEEGQRHYTNANGEKELGVINKIRREGDWDDWGRTLPSQFLSKQPKELIQKALDATYSDKEAEFEEIKSLTNPQIKKKLLLEFADGLDASAVDLKARSLPGQSVQVILPDPNVKVGEIYAPNYEPGTYVALVRYPHGGIFEIPICKVNNNIKSCKEMLGNGKDTPVDAVVINSKTAAQLSGADFDGDTVTVIPTHGDNGIKISNKPYYEELKNYDHCELYKSYPGMKVISKQNMQKQMGVVSNLITDMTVKGADDDQIIRAVKHSMTIIDAKKHELDYKASYDENGIRELQIEWQGKPTGGASTLFSRAKSEYRVEQRKEGVLVDNPDKPGTKKRIFIDPETGEKLYTLTNKTSTKLSASAKKRVKEIENDPELDVDEKRTKISSIYADEGQDYKVQTVSTQMYEAKDAHSLSSGTVKETIYANYANSVKALANKARLEYLATPDMERNPDAAKKYDSEVKSLQRKLDDALMNAPRERQAQMLANKRYGKELEKDPSLKDDKEAASKVKTSLLTKARIETGANGQQSRIKITDSEWEAIQNRAISKSFLNQILNHTDSDKLKERAMPKTESNAISDVKQSRIKTLSATGFSADEIAKSVGVSVSTVIKYIK